MLHAFGGSRALHVNVPSGPPPLPPAAAAGDCGALGNTLEPVAGKGAGSSARWPSPELEQESAATQQGSAEIRVSETAFRNEPGRGAR
jgi:hypothetical protein